MDYKDIFQPNTLEKLDSKSKENLKKILGNKTLLQTMMSSGRLLQEIVVIEKPYISKLEQLAMKMVREMYPILDDNEVILDAKITSVGEVNRTLDEIKIEKPNILGTKILHKVKQMFPDAYLTKDFLNREGSFHIYFYKRSPQYLTKDSISYDAEDNKYNIALGPEDFHGRYFKNIDNGLKYLQNKKKDLDSLNNINESTPEAKRRVINSISQGSALYGTFSFYMFKEYLDEIDPSLVEKYNQLMKEVFGVYDDDNTIAMFLQAIASGQKMGGGSSKVIINEVKIEKPWNLPLEQHSKEFEKIISKIEEKYPKWSSNKQWNYANKLFKQKYKVGVGEKLNNSLNEQEQNPTIQARAVCFPMLVHELIKGIYELVSLQGFTGDKEQNQSVVDKVDKLENEPYDLRYGKFIFQALNNIYIEYYDGDDNRVREYLFADIYKLSNEEFVSFIENAINENLTSYQQRWVKNTIRDIVMDIRRDDYEASGLDEIKM